ncbi:MAG: hypothetical protein HY647_12735 [Acidobacteria bacterium]|nr:hypothetical protein [Acidobacteriota bacterium]
MNSESTNLYAGLSGFALVPERYDLGEGLLISQTYAHFMAPFLMAFAPAAPGKHHPAPWKAAKGGLAYDIYAELYVPLGFSPSKPLDRLNTVWWLTALIRLKATTLAFVPVIASEPFSSIPVIQEEPQLWPIEIHTHRLRAEANPNQAVNLKELGWIRDYWMSGAVLMGNEDFNFAFQAFDQSIWASTPSLGLVSLWGALERLFSKSSYELSFRISANIACFLEPLGKNRFDCYKKVKKLYDSRSKAAHGVGGNELQPFQETYALTRRVLIRILEENRVTVKEEMEAKLFGDEEFLIRTAKGSANLRPH